MDNLIEGVCNARVPIEGCAAFNRDRLMRARGAGRNRADRKVYRPSNSAESVAALSASVAANGRF